VLSAAVGMVLSSSAMTVIVPGLLPLAVGALLRIACGTRAHLIDSGA